MLVLSRKLHEVIRIGDHIKVTICEIRTGKHGSVRIGIDAPEDVEIHRQEVWARVQQEKAIEPRVIEALVSHVTALDAQEKLDEGWFVCLTCGATVHRSEKQHSCYSLPRTH